jgi:hypothetical protein
MTYPDYLTQIDPEKMTNDHVIGPLFAVVTFATMLTGATMLGIFIVEFVRYFF